MSDVQTNNALGPTESPAQEVLAEETTHTAQRVMSQSETALPLIEPTNHILKPSYIYVAGKLRPHFPTRGLEKEYDAASQSLGANPSDFNKVFTYQENNQTPYRYIAEQVSWILSVSGQDVYVLLPNSSDELNEFIDSLIFDADSNLADETYSVAIGSKGPLAPEEYSNGEPLPMVNCHHLYHFTTAQLQDELNDKNTTTIAISNVLEALTKQPNTGASDFDRAKNFAAFRYPSIYATRLASNQSSSYSSSNPDDEQFLENLELKHSNVAPGRKIVDIILTYQKNISGRQTSYYASIDVTDLYPFLHSNLTIYIPTN
ncbi:hypothetical protein MED121_16934 [Marinomonas sp. MED121]|uniref:cyanobactin maturation protease PatG family protein n=1 Tax=Marinomonas sp. MED121 TaxID=314277 RepID=UPI000069103B|nr:hypothetical protein [Marinomonas sp. MED121]EAQ67632.1 hypothetical protein MED121_16934 [Marinomonas sp. MED121]